MKYAESTDTKLRLEKFVSQVLDAKQDTWYPMNHRILIRKLPNGRIELKSQVPGYDSGDPICMYQEHLPEVAQVFLLLGRELTQQQMGAP